MNFFFVRDHLNRLRFYSSSPLGPILGDSSKSRKIWEKAKKKVTGLHPRTLLQGQAFDQGGKLAGNELEVHASGAQSEKSIRLKLAFFLHRQRTKYVLILIGEALILPISGLAALLPGPNVFFYVLAVLMIIQWQALRGISRILRKKIRIVSDSFLADWEAAVEAGETSRFPEILETLEKEHGFENLRKLLWK